MLSCLVMSNSLGPYGLWPASLLCPWDFPGRNTGVGCHFDLQGIFLTQGSNLRLLHCRWILYYLSPQGSPVGQDIPCQTSCIIVEWPEKLQGVASL